MAYISDAKAAVRAFRKRNAANLFNIRAILNDEHRTKEGKQLAAQPLIEKQKAAFEETRAAIAKLVDSAREHYDRCNPREVSRRIAIATAEGAQRAATMRSMLQGVSNAELLASARAAREANDNAAAHAIRLELDIRLANGSIKFRHDADVVRGIRDALLFPKVVDEYNAAVADFVSTKCLLAALEGVGPMFDQRTAGGPLARLKAWRAAASVPDHEGGAPISFTQDDVGAMFELLGESNADDGMPAPAPRAKAMTPIQRIIAAREQAAREREETAKTAAARTTAA